MKKEVLLPLGKYKTGRDLPSGVYLITALGDYNAVIYVIDTNGNETDYYLYEPGTQCRIELSLGDILHISNGKVKIARISDFSIDIGDKEVLLPLGKYKTGRDLPSGVYLITALDDYNADICVIDANENETDYYLFEKAMQCRVELSLGDILHINNGKVKITQISKFLTDFKDTNPKEKAQTIPEVPETKPTQTTKEPSPFETTQTANAPAPFEAAQTSHTRQAPQPEVRTQPALNKQNSSPSKTLDDDIGNLWNKNIAEYYVFQKDRLQRGLDYFKYGKVKNLSFSKGSITAQVNGSRIEPYDVKIHVDSATSESQLLPSKWQISSECNCPDMSKPCKHVVAVLYAVGEELKTHPYLLNYLRNFPLKNS